MAERKAKTPKKAKAPKVDGLVKKLAAVKIEDLHAELEKQAPHLMAMAADPALAFGARNPALEGQIRQYLQSGLLLGTLLARQTPTPEDDKYVARALRITQIDSEWATVANFIWGPPA